MAHCNEKKDEMIPLSLLENANAHIFTTHSMLRCLGKLSRIKMNTKWQF